MPVHSVARPPLGHGEVLCDPPFATWGDLARANADAAGRWPTPLRALRAQARAEALEVARRFGAATGIGAVEGPADGPIIATGHQPGLFHPGVWVKHLLVQRLADEMGATGLDVMVDTDAAGRIVLRVPCLEPTVRACEVPLVDVPEGAAYVQASVPSAPARAAFRHEARATLERLPAPAVARHFERFADALDAAAAATEDAGAWITVARRLYERPLGTTYLEAPLSAQVRGSAFRHFAGMLLADAPRLRATVNDALAAYRSRTGTRSAAQPFPDLGEDGDRVEAPLWALMDGRRLPVSIDTAGVLYAGDDPVVSVGSSPSAIAAALAREDLILAPKAIALTLFERVFVADLFVHGTGGGRYDRVTDDVITRWLGVAPPAFVVASLTMLLPLGGRIVSDREVSELEERLNRCVHNPDRMLDELEFDSAAERTAAEALRERKTSLVAAIAAPGADRKALGHEIRAVNAELGELVAPVTDEVRRELERAREARDACAVLTDRTYPFCLWDPREVADKVR